MSDNKQKVKGRGRGRAKAKHHAKLDSSKPATRDEQQPGGLVKRTEQHKPGHDSRSQPLSNPTAYESGNKESKKQNEYTTSTPSRPKQIYTKGASNSRKDQPEMQSKEATTLPLTPPQSTDGSPPNVGNIKHVSDSESSTSSVSGIITPPASTEGSPKVLGSKES